jgi:hypothetical protein
MWASLGAYMAFHTNIRQGFKGLSGTNTLACYEHSQIAFVKILQHWDPGLEFKTRMTSPSSLPSITDKFKIKFCGNIFDSPGANVKKLFTLVIYRHSMVMPSFCAIKLYYQGMALNYHGKKFYNIVPRWQT